MNRKWSPFPLAPLVNGLRIVVACSVLHSWPKAKGEGIGRSPTSEDPLESLELPSDLEAPSLNQKILFPNIQPPESHPLPPPPTTGPLLASIPGVELKSNQMTVNFRGGVARIGMDLRFESMAQWNAEVSYRFRLPAQSLPTKILVCAENGACREGRPWGLPSPWTPYEASFLLESPPTIPIASLEKVGSDEWLLRAAPISKRSVGADAHIHPGVLHVHLEFMMGIQAHGGAAFVYLPPTPQDARVVRPTITFSVEGWSTPTINGLEYGEEEAFEIFPGQPTVLSSLLPRVRKLWWNAWAAPCADQLCLWLELQAPLPSIHPIDAVLAIDISPSTRGVHLKRIVVVAQRLTSLLPTASRIMPVAFASRAIELTPSFQKDLPPELWHRLDELDLGRSTRWLPLCRLLSSLSTAQSHLFWIGDGGLTPTQGDHECARELMSKNVKVHLISVAPPSTPFLELARVLHTTPLVLPREAMDMSSTDSRELDHWLKEVLSPMPPQPIHLRWSRRERIDLWLYPGEFTNLFLPISPSDIPRINRTPLRVRPASPSLSALLLAIHQPARRLIAAPSFRSLPPCPPSLPTTFAIPSVPHTCSSISPIPSTIHHTQPPPPQSVQRALHRQILPCARDCFRSDRRGRSSHQARVEVEFVWHQGEIESIETKGNATPSLQDCVAQCFERLELPQVEHPLRVRWALYNLPEEREPPLPIDEELGASIEALFPTSSDSSYPILLAR